MKRWNASQKKTQGGSFALKAKNFAYRVENGIYINLTNRCTNDCSFCIRHNGDGAYGSGSLWLEIEPSAEEAFSAVQALYFPACKEFVFCGYGEPTMRLDTLLETAAKLKASYRTPIRLNTNGQAPLLYGEDVTPRFEGLIDCVSISLNTPDAQDYVSLCHPVYGKKAYEAMLSFTEACTRHVPDVQMSVVGETLDKYQLAMCRAIADRCHAKLRIRNYIGKNGQENSSFKG